MRKKSYVSKKKLHFNLKFKNIAEIFVATGKNIEVFFKDEK